MKTASLFAAACRAGAIEAKASPKLINLMREYGAEVGIAYQLADDLVDILNGKFEEGLIMPIIRVYGDSLDHHLIEKLKQNGTDILEETLRRSGYEYCDGTEVADWDIFVTRCYRFDDCCRCGDGKNPSSST